MKRILLFLILIFSCASSIGQNIERVEVNGIIFSDNNDVENVAVYNTSSNKGTITNNKGEFIINVALNDIIEISALQFKSVLITITKDVVDSKLLKIYLKEFVNQLDAVLLSSGLSGNLTVDVVNAEELPKLQLDLGNMNALEFFDDKAFDNNGASSELNKIINKGGLYNGIDFAGLLGLNKILKSRKKEKSGLITKKQIDVLDIYSHKFISETCNILLENVESFIMFIEAEGIKDELYKPENEVYLIDFLIKQSKEFLKLEDAKH
ncbi:hypothetical protein [uncultured Wocania sp.]|uniref:hypothetical protein n=1 Tax=uncultured Wocania sp. TaxID=2834404 RepID=UPI0030FAD8D1